MQPIAFFFFWDVSRHSFPLPHGIKGVLLVNFLLFLFMQIIGIHAAVLNFGFYNENFFFRLVIDGINDLS